MSAIQTVNNGNPGIVPPWLTKPQDASKNPGIVPPWLTEPAKPGDKNPGIVPPWLTGVGASAVTTTFVREPADVSPLSTSGQLIRF